MGRLPKKKAEPVEFDFPPMQTRASQRLKKIQSELRGEARVDEKKSANEKVKTMKASNSKKQRKQSTQSSKQAADESNGIHSKAHEMSIENTNPAPQQEAPAPASMALEPIATQNPGASAKSKEPPRLLLPEDIDDEFEEILTKKKNNTEQQQEPKPALHSIKTPLAPNQPTQKSPLSKLNNLKPGFNKKEQRKKSEEQVEDDDMEQMLRSNEKKNEKIIDEPILSINPSISGNYPSIEPANTPVARNSRQGHINFRHEDFVIESNRKVEDTYFFIKPPLGSGMFGTVYKAKHKKTGVFRAIKRIKKDMKNTTSLEALLKDVDILKTLDHPNIIKVYEYYQDEGSIYIVTELCTGGELFEQIIKEKNFTERKAGELMRQMLSAIAYCHEKKLVHCDLKPENIIFESQSNNNLVKIIDFGNSSFCEGDSKLSNRFGSVYYVAPEVLMGSYTEKCDVWSLGVIMYLILSGKPPFNGVNDQIILKKVYEGKFNFDGPEWQNISADAKDLISKMLTFDFNNRITARKCLEHKWIKELGKVEDHKLSLPIGKRSLRNLKTFKAESKMQEAIMYFIVNQLMNKDEKEDLMNAFMALDTDHDGKLTREDLIRAYVKVGEDPESVSKMVDSILQNIDKSDKGFIDYTEYMTASLSKRRMFSEDRLTAAFNLFDEEQRGYITTDDFKALLNKGAFAQVDESLWNGLINDVTGDTDRMDFESFKKMVGLFTQNEQITQSLALY